VYELYFLSCMNIIFNELRQQRVKYDVYTMSKIKHTRYFLSHRLLFLLLIYRRFYLELFCNGQQYNQTGVSWPTQAF